MKRSPLACLDRTSPVGVIGCGVRDVRVPPSLAKDQVLQWLLRLRRHAFDEQTRLVRRIAELRPTLTARSIIVVCSDLHEPGAVHAVALLAQQHEVAVLQFQDPAELALPGTASSAGSWNCSTATSCCCASSATACTAPGS